MDKNYLLQEIKRGLSEGTITSSDLASLSSFSTDNSVAEMSGLEEVKDKSSSNKITEAFFYIGAILIAIGISVVIGENWEALGSFLRVLVTLGTGVIAFITAVLLENRNTNVKISNAIHIIAIFALPLGLNILFYEMGVDIEALSMQAVLATLMSLIYLPMLFLRKTEVYLVVGTAWALYLLGVITTLLNQNINLNQTLITYEVIFHGAIVMTVGNYFSSKMHKGWPRFGSILQFFGSITVLGGFFSFVYGSALYSMVFPLLALGMMYLGVRQGQKWVYAVSSIYLTVYLIWLTFRIFPDVTFALVFSGIIIMLLGWGSFTVQKKYLVRKYSNPQS